jgi:hypothetical protein
MDLAKRDIGIQHLQHLIKKREDMLLETKKHLQHQSKENKYLKAIVEDYDKYTDDMYLEKQNQYKALQLLHEYLIQLTLDPTSTEEILRQVKFDRSLILAEMKKVNY